MNEIHVRFLGLGNETPLLDLLLHIRNEKPLKPEIKIEDVQIACQIGSGKFSDVFLAIVGPDCYALKIFKPYHRHRADEERDTLLLLTKYCVPNIPRLISAFTISETRRRALLMDLMYEHYDISKIRQLNIDLKLAIIYKILSTIKTANQAGIIHGNICPSNVLIDSSLDQFRYNFDPKDNKDKNFDLKKFINILVVGWNTSIRSQDSKTFQRIFFNKSVPIQYSIGQKDKKIYGGNNLFKAPELLIGKNSITSKVDIWSIGCLFVYFLLDDSHPLWGKKEKSTRLPENLGTLRRIAEEIGPDEVLDTCKDYIPPEHIGVFSSISRVRPPFTEVSIEFVYSLDCIIKDKILKDLDGKLNTELKDFVETEFEKKKTIKSDFKSCWKEFYRLYYYPNEKKSEREVPSDLNSLIEAISGRQASLIDDLNKFVRQCICISEYTRCNTVNALEKVIEIRGILNNFQESLTQIVDYFSSHPPKDS